MKLEDLAGAKILGIKSAKAKKDKDGKWIPVVKVVFEKKGIVRSLPQEWKRQKKATREEAENYASTYGIMALKQRYKFVEKS